MTDLAASNVTLTTNDRDKDFGHRGLGKNMSVFSISFGDGALTYPSGGIPLPAIGNFGMRRQIDFMSIEPDPDDGFVYKFDQTNHKLRIYTQGIVTGSTGGSPADSTGGLAENSAAAETTVQFLGASSADTTYDLGPLIELPTTVAPAATTIKALVVGE